MKILYHHRTASRDGQSTHITEMILAMRHLGHQVTECAPAVGEYRAGGGSPGWVGKVKAWLPKALYELAEIAYSLVALRKLISAVRHERPDCIYERYNLYLFAGIWARRIFGLPLVLEVNAPMALERRQYGGLMWPRLADWAEKYVWSRADLVLPVTQVLADYMVGIGIDARKIRVVPNAINEDHYMDLPSSAEAKAALRLDGRLVIGFTGFVREWDRLERIVEWMATRMQHYPLHLMVIGDGPARASIERAAAAHGISDRLSFTGAVERDRVPSLSMAFDVALQTALVPYASPLCLFEYLALGKAIVAPDQPNHHEILVDGRDAALYPPEDAQGIEKVLDLVCADAELRQRLGQAAAELIVKKRLTWRAHAARIVDEVTQLKAA